MPGPRCRAVTAALGSCLLIQGLVHLHPGWNVLSNVFGNMGLGVVMAFHLRFVFWGVSPVANNAMAAVGMEQSCSKLSGGEFQGTQGSLGFCWCGTLLDPQLGLLHAVTSVLSQLQCDMCLCWLDVLLFLGELQHLSHQSSHLEMWALTPARWSLTWAGQHPVPLDSLLITKIPPSRKRNEILFIHFTWEQCSATFCSDNQFHVTVWVWWTCPDGKCHQFQGHLNSKARLGLHASSCWKGLRSKHIPQRNCLKTRMWIF